MGFFLRALVALTGVTAVGAAGVALVSNDDDAAITASVVRIIDGDTFVADMNGEEKRIRLLNVDTPELDGENGEAECMAVEARGFLAGQLPPGTDIELRYDQEEQDHYGRELAAVYLHDTLINETIAREGLGVAVSYKPNTTYYSRVAKAEESARNAGLGIHSSDLECTVAHRVEQVASGINPAIPVVLGALTVAQLADQITSYESDLKKLLVLKKMVESPSDFAKAAYASHAEEKVRIDELIRETESSINEAEEAQAEKLRKEEQHRREREERERIEAERIEAERIAEEQRAVTERVAEEERRRAAQAVPQSNPVPSRSVPSYDNYTGCRAYGGNYAMNSIDAQGRPYAKIDCSTRVQIS